MSTNSGCARPTGAFVGEKTKHDDPVQEEVKPMEVKQAKVGQKAPDFKAPAFYQGEFTEISLSDYLDEWLLLCFYPGDFTFV